MKRLHDALDLYKSQITKVGLKGLLCNLSGFGLTVFFVLQHSMMKNKLRHKLAINKWVTFR